MSIGIVLDDTLYRVSAEGDDYVVRVKRNLLERDDLNHLLDYLLVRSILRRSQATQDEIDALANEVEQRAWTRLEPLFTFNDAAS